MNGYKLGFIGVGVMAGAILDRTLEHANALGLTAGDIVIYDPLEEKTAPYAKQGVCVAESASAVLAAETVVLGVKPQAYADIFKEHLEIHAKTVVSIMAGVRIATLRNVLGSRTGIARVMPNTPARVGKGMSAVCFDGVTAEQRIFILGILDACGKVLEIAEEKFDAVTSISGSGPAYVYLFAAGLVQGGVAGGLTAEESRTLALQTIEGAAALAAVTPVPLETLTERVCSKGGTTIEAVDLFKARGLEEIIQDGVTACREKSKLLSEKL